MMIMKRNILSLAVIAASLFSFNAMAQAAGDNAKAACPATECKATVCPETGCAPETCPGPGKQCRPQRPCSADPFKGITLTQDQQSRLNALKEQRKAKCDAQKKECRERAGKRDSVARSGKKEYLESVKEILTPDQYVVFLENIVLSNPGHGPGASPRHARAVKKDMRNFKKGDFKKADMKKADVRRADRSDKSDKK